MSTGVDLHPDFGPSYGDGPNYGIPITVVGGDAPQGAGPLRLRRARATRSATRSATTPGSRAAAAPTATGTRSSSTRSTCRLYETFATRGPRGRWQAGSGAVWSLRSNKLRPDGWTSADAAGLPILPGPAALERGAGRRRSTTRSGSPPTSPRRAPPVAGPPRRRLDEQPIAYPPMGARFRLKAGFSTRRALGATPARWSRAMKTYGLVLADNGSPWFFQGEQNAQLAGPADRGPQDRSRPRPSSPSTPRRCRSRPNSAQVR